MILMMAKCTDRLELVKMLIQAGANVEDVSDTGLNALQYCRMNACQRDDGVERCLEEIFLKKGLMGASLQTLALRKVVLDMTLDQIETLRSDFVEQAWDIFWSVYHPNVRHFDPELHGWIRFLENRSLQRILVSILESNPPQKEQVLGVSTYTLTLPG